MCVCVRRRNETAISWAAANERGREQEGGASRPKRDRWEETGMRGKGGMPETPMSRRLCTRKSGENDRPRGRDSEKADQRIT